MEDFGLWDVIVSMFWFTLLVMWIWMIISILTDIFRDHELNGAAKAAWTVFILVLPWIGAICYIFARGNSMNERTRRAQLEQQASMRAFAQETAVRGTSVSEELRELAQLRDSGTISPDEYQQAKAKVLT
ncbi:SHOCT domain-containing protein [Nocardioides sp. W7]|uniref:SHOCT domain-containing protein n=1 Tax=Nocardioides sp. W7 TaxID=2931390 RepID=UPI001FD54163|nr:SHOCT domain-containing protein [Nocardioides sp. W7]